MVDPRYRDLSYKVITPDDSFSRDKQHRETYSKIVRAWDASATYFHGTTYLGEVLIEHPTSLEVRLWPENFDGAPETPNGEVTSIKRNHLEPIGAAHLGAIIQYDEISIRQFSINRPRKIGELEISDQYLWGFVQSEGGGNLGFRLFHGGVAGVAPRPEWLCINAEKLGYNEPTMSDVIQITFAPEYTSKNAVDSLRESGPSNKVKVKKLGFIDIPFIHLTDDTIKVLSG